MCYSVQTLSGRTPLHQKSSDFFFGAANIRIFPFSAKLFPPSPEDCKSDKALPRGEGLGGGNVDDCAPIYWSIIRQPEDCKSDKAIPRGEGLGGGNVDDCALIY